MKAKPELQKQTRYVYLTFTHLLVKTLMRKKYYTEEYDSTYFILLYTTLKQNFSGKRPKISPCFKMRDLSFNRVSCSSFGAPLALKKHGFTCV